MPTIKPKGVDDQVIEDRPTPDEARSWPRTEPGPGPGRSSAPPQALRLRRVGKGTLTDWQGSIGESEPGTRRLRARRGTVPRLRRCGRSTGGGLRTPGRVQFGVPAGCGDQLGMRPPLHDPATIHDEVLVM